jgi:hypothetical protein
MRPKKVAPHLPLLPSSPRRRELHPRFWHLRLPHTPVERWFALFPYGKFICSDGREVLFNRDYMALFERRPGEPARPADCFEWVENIIKHEWYFHDGSFRGIERGLFTLARLNAVLAEWGLPQLPPRPNSRRRN